MTFTSETRAILQTVKSQLASNNPHTTGITFSHNFDSRAKEAGFTRKDAAYIYNHGQQDKATTIAYQYPDKKVGISYYRNEKTGKPVITGIFRYGPFKK